MSTEQKPGQIQVKQVEKTIADKVINKVIQMEQLNQLDLPKDYSAPNALQAAWLILLQTVDKSNRPVLESCTKESIANALLNMVLDGLSVSKGQGAFIAYGSTLTFSRMYAGNMAIAKRSSGVVDVKGKVIYEKDEFEYKIHQNGRTEIIKHNQSLANIDPNKILGAYAVVTFQDGSTDAEIMPYHQIKMAWAQNKANNPAQLKFPDQMSIKTVINRVLKPLIRSTNDSAIMTTDEREFEDVAEYEEIQDPVKQESTAAIADGANATRVSMDDEDPVPVAENASPTEPSF